MHHIRPWSEGGPTDDANLAEVCSACHRVVHLPGYCVRGDPRTDDLVLHTPDGRIIRARSILNRRDKSA